MKNKLNFKKLKIGLFGGSGKMGHEVQKALQQTGHTPYLFVGKTRSSIFSISIVNLQNVEKEILNDVDVWIDFSSAEGLFELMKNTTTKPIVSGSTGLKKKQVDELKKQSRRRVLFWASNMSLGLWCFRQALKSFSVIADFDFAIDEIHHLHKKDNPSGTALTLQQDLQAAVHKKIKTPSSHRLGGVFGIHTVYAGSADEFISFQHQALTRKVFATGAIRAAEWAVAQKNGFYSMDDMFLKKGKI